MLHTILKWLVSNLDLDIVETLALLTSWNGNPKKDPSTHLNNQKSVFIYVTVEKKK